MDLKQIWSKAGSWFGNLFKKQDYHVPIDDLGLISHDIENQQSDSQAPECNHIVVKTSPQVVRTESMEKLQESFNNLIEQLSAINKHLDCQIAQRKDLLEKINELPELLKGFPAVVETQKKLTENMLEQLKASTARQQQFVDIVEKIPLETAKQTDALAGIDHQLAASADTDVQIAENFNSQSDSILQMSKTFSASDRHLKYLVSIQNKRFMWLFIIAISVCTTVILLFAGIILYLKK